MSTFKTEPGKGSLWDGKGSGPTLSGYVCADRDIKAGDKIPLALWKREKKTETSPSYGVNVDRWKETQRQPVEAGEKPQETFQDDKDLPF